MAHPAEPTEVSCTEEAAYAAAAAPLSENKIARIKAKLANPKFVAEGKDAAMFARLDRKTLQMDHVTVGAISPENILRQGSITKTLLSFIALKHNIPLEKTVFSEMPHYEPSKYAGSDAITFRHLLNHTSGILSYSELPNATTLSDHFTPPVILDLAWKDKPLNMVPGSAFFYSNTNSEVVATWLMQATGKDPKDWFNAEFRDQGLPTLYLATAEKRNFPDTMSGYANHTMPWHFPSVSGTLESTAEDMMKAMDKMAKEKAIWTQMQQWRPDAIPKLPDPEDPAGGQKYGFFLQEYHFKNGVKALGHDGHIGVASFVVANEDFVYYIHATNDYATADWMAYCHAIIDEIHTPESA